MSIPSNKNDEIDLNNIFKSIKRNTKQLVIFSSTSTIIIFSYLLTLPPIWRGNFNILVKSKNSTELNNSQLFPGTILNFNPIDNSNETQKLILQSPLVLKPVFEYVVDYKKNKNEFSNSFTFKSWVKTLVVDFEKNSNVLNITHDNSDKELLFNTLNLISKNYKEYSKKDQIQNILNTRKYLESQRKIMSEKSALSQSKFNKFAVENRLGNFDGLILDKDFSQNSNTEFSQTEKDQIDKNFGSRFQNQFTLLNQLEAEFTNLSKYLKPNSKTLEKLSKEIEYLKKSLERPNEIFLKYKELSNEALRDENLLSDIENNLELAKLEQIKTPNPWQLISTPTIYREPISLSKKKKIILALTLSIFLGSLFVILREKITGFLFNKSEIESKLNTQYLQTINKKEDDLSVRLILNYLNNNFSSTSDNLLGIINYKSKSDLSYLKAKLSKYPNILILDFLDKRIDTIEKLIIINEEGKLNNNDINSLNKFISIYKNKLIGWLFLTD